jgi:polyisoprenoid-binding protein YceI
MLKRILALVVVIVGLGAFGIWYFFIRDTAPPPATLTTRSTVKPSGTVDGSYKVEDGTTTFAGFRINEHFDVGSHTAVVRSPKVSGTLSLSGTQVSGVTVTVDLSELQSFDKQPPGVPGVGNRVGSLQSEGLEIERFPDAKFVETGAITLPNAPKVGQEIDTNAAGKLTLHGVTKDVTIPIKARWNGALIDVNGSLPVKLSDYSITAPQRPFVTVGGNGTLEFDLTFTK